jgi:hypothetical protein
MSMIRLGYFLGVITLISLGWLSSSNSLISAQVSIPSMPPVGGISSVSSITSIEDLFPSTQSNVSINVDENAVNSDLRREALRNGLAELAFEGITGRTLEREIAEEELVQERTEQEQALEFATNQQEQRIQGLQERELATEAENVAAELNPVFGTCGASGTTGTFDAAISIIKGRISLDDVIRELNGKDKFTIELITNLKPANLGLVLLDSNSAILKGRIIVGEEPKQETFDYKIDQVDTVCHQVALKEETNIIESKRDEPAVIPSETRLNPIFQSCGNDADFAKSRITGRSTDLQRVNDDGTVDLTVKIFVDLRRVEAEQLQTYVIPDNNRVIAARLIIDEGKSNTEQILDFILDKVATDCNDLDYLSSPTDITDDDEIVNPLHGFERS